MFGGISFQRAIRWRTAVGPVFSVIPQPSNSVRLLEDNRFDARGYRDRLDQQPACLNVLEFNGPVKARLMLFNDVSHYADQPRRPGAGLSKWWDVPETPG